MKVEADGKTTIYVVKGKVIARDETGQEKTVPQSTAINESLEEIKLSKEVIRSVLMWRGQLKLPLGRFARIG